MLATVWESRWLPQHECFFKAIRAKERSFVRVALKRLGTGRYRLHLENCISKIEDI